MRLRVCGDAHAGPVDISKQSFAPGVNLAFIASGTSFPDALSGAPIAGVTSSPVLLVPGTSIPTVVKDELTRLQPQYIIVLGGEGVVSAAVERQLADLAVTGVVERLAGQNRFETSANIAREVFSEVVADTVFVANGMTFPDALAAGPAAGLAVAPMLLVQPGAIPGVIAKELARLEPTNIVIMGGEGAVSAGVEKQLQKYAPNVVRAWGDDRFGTAVDLSSWFWDGFATSTVFVANGEQFPDALAIAPVGTMAEAPILLVSARSIPEVVKQELIARQPQRIVIVGGPGAVSSTVAKQLKQYLVP